MDKPEIFLRDVFLARQRCSGFAQKTPLLHSSALSASTGYEVFLKLENLQQTGSFKIRGAANKLLSLSSEERQRGVLAFSTGNHGRAVAYVAAQLGIRSVICMSHRVPRYRVEAMEALGGEVVLSGQSQDEAYLKALELERKEGLIMVKPFDDPHVIAGQGTIGIEILEDLPEVDSLLIPLSGGGLLAGIALAMKATSPAIKIVGVGLEVSCPMQASLQAGLPVEIEEKDSLGDALLGGIGLDNCYTFPMVRDLVDEVILVSEKEIAAGMFYAFDTHRQVIEGAGAVGIAALLVDKTSHLGKNLAVVVSGGNVDPRLLAEIAWREYA
ncbi:MAG: hydroxyectoine utilization dehydratase EutB [Desulfuromonadales bacterium]|nr:hydroxyectoine utilization dehydratase EutB [Desulfuromonadales bacterium]